MKPGTSIALVLLSLVFAGHLARLVFKIELVIGTTVMPMWLSVVAVVVSGAAILLLWREARPTADQNRHRTSYRSPRNGS